MSVHLKIFGLKDYWSDFIGLVNDYTVKVVRVEILEKDRKHATGQIKILLKKKKRNIKFSKI